MNDTSTTEPIASYPGESVGERARRRYDDVVEQGPGVALGRAGRTLRPPQEAQDAEEEVLRAARRGARLRRLSRVLRQQEEIREQAPAEAQNTVAQLLQHQQTRRHQAQARDRALHQGRVLLPDPRQRERAGRVVEGDAEAAERGRAGRGAAAAYIR